MAYIMETSLIILYSPRKFSSSPRITKNLKIKIQIIKRLPLVDIGEVERAIVETLKEQHVCVQVELERRLEYEWWKVKEVRETHKERPGKV